MWFDFLILGLLVSAVVWLASNKKLSKPIRLMAAGLFMLASIFAMYLLGSQTFLDDSIWYERSPYKEVLLFVFMLTGMAARYMTFAIEERRKKLAASTTTSQRKPGIDFDIWEFSYPMFASVITFGTLLQQLGDESLTLANIIISFQTGFFWQTLLTRSQPAES